MIILRCLEGKKWVKKGQNRLKLEKLLFQASFTHLGGFFDKNYQETSQTFIWYHFYCYVIILRCPRGKNRVKIRWRYTGKVCSGITVELQWNDCDLVLTTVVHCIHSLATLNWRLMTAVTALTWMLLFLLWYECKTYWWILQFNFS